MANTPISGLPNGAPALGTDLVVIARSGANYNLTLTQITTLMGASFIAGAGTVVDNAVIRANGTTGLSLQQSPVIIDDSGNITGCPSVTTAIVANTTGGTLTVRTANAATGQALNLIAGNSTGSGTAGGAIVLDGGNGTAGNAAGGAIVLTPGTGFGSSAAGALSLAGSAGGATGAGSTVTIAGGAGGATSGAGGNIVVTAGSATAGNSNGGNVVITPGAKTGSGLGGVVSIASQTTAVGVSAAAATVTQSIINLDDTSASSHAALNILTGGASGGNPFVEFTVQSVSAWSMGIVQSASNAFVIANAASPSSPGIANWTTAGALTNAAGITATTGNIAAAAGSVTAATTVTATLGNITATNGNLVLGTAGNKLSIATGSNASVGTSAAMTAGTITIATTAVTASSKIWVSTNTFGGVPGVVSAPTASIVPGTSFDIVSSVNTDTSTVNWLIVN